MSNLSHWVYAKDFTAHEAAYLILGVDPSTDTDSRSARHIKERLSDAYAGALENLQSQIFVEPCLSESFWDEKHERLAKHETLHSVAMDSLLNNYKEGDDVSISAWLERGRNHFLEQRFSRVELGRWITENQLVSHYSFTSNQMPQQSMKSEGAPMDKPLTTRERDTLLTIIAALAKAAKVPLDDYSQPGKAAGYIEGLTAELGARVSKRAIEEHLKKIPNALETRMK